MLKENLQGGAPTSIVPSGSWTLIWLRVAAVLITLGTIVAACLPAVATAQLQVLLLLSVLANAACFGLATGLAAATGGLILILGRDFRTTGSLTISAVVDAIVWFAIAKFSVALVAMQRRQSVNEHAARQKAEASARQQTLLLREMTHRTRNDMQRLIGMLNAQASANPAAATVLHHAAGRMLVQTRLNERLAMRGAETMVESREFLEELGNDLRNIVELGQSVGITISAEGHFLAPAVAADIGLIVNELVTNALKHGFPGSAGGIIRVVFRRVGEYDELYELLVTDNGIGSDPASGSSGHGQHLLRALASQLGGRLVISRGEVGGTQCRLSFPVATSGAVPGNELPFGTNTNKPEQIVSEVRKPGTA